MVDEAACLVRKITTAGVVSTVAGTPSKCELQTGSLPGALSAPTAAAYAGPKTLVLTLASNHVVKVVLP